MNSADSDRLVWQCQNKLLLPFQKRAHHRLSRMSREGNGIAWKKKTRSHYSVTHGLV
jgi:hypothetical protein